ncbi:tetratricopeptide repeat protein 39C-like isoform X2 [Tigriopus californicus]|uniref:tetratricopeptide repeat protein 39C-like isoform X2 n=1 Tax=Tigriopus californicus TaxID=6832 RepID=UPI0027DA1AF1|nr:tetratricopeptide repeat protein 39C-like isoform X2 [Tigriopus californicus]
MGRDSTGITALSEWEASENRVKSRESINMDDCLDHEENWHLAARGIQLALNNRVEDAQNLLKSDPANSIHSQAGYCFLTFMNAVMTFEEDKMSQSLVALRAMEKRCCSNPNPPPSSSSGSSGNPNISNGFSGMTLSPSFTSFHGMKSKMQGLFNTIPEQQADSNRSSQGGGEFFANGDEYDESNWGSYMKGGWVLRKAWKIYQKAYTQIRRIYMQKVGLQGNLLAPPPVPNQPQSHGPSTPNGFQNGTPSSNKNGNKRNRSTLNGISHSLSVPLSLFSLVKEANNAQDTTSNASGSIGGNEEDLGNPSTISAATIKRLMSAVSFGFGIFHLAVSLLPPKLLNIISFFGFEGDRQTGIQALHFARQGNDMRGPIATLALLWFHTIVRPFFGLDGLNVKSGAEAAQRLIDASKPEFANSALFLFFQGRVERLKANFSDALNSYEKALSVSAQREIQLLCLHEVGWSYLLLLQWEQSSRAFLQLKSDSRWSKSFYCYLSAVSLGASGDTEQCLELARETPKLARKAGNQQLERFLLRRATKMVQDQVDENYSRLLGYELLYLWNTLGACLKHSTMSIQLDCENIYVPALEGVRQLILGSIYSNSGLVLEAKQSYGKAIKQGSEVDGGDIHAAAFAAYELGLLLCRTAETRSEGRHYLEFARDNYRNYDFEHRLSVRIQAALRYYSDNIKERRAQEMISS